MSYQLPQEIKNILVPLSEGVLPLQAWLLRKTFIPDPNSLVPSENALPWRVGGVAKLDNGLMESVSFFEEQFNLDAENQAMIPRWSMLKARPLTFFQPRQGSADEWRKNRHLPVAGMNPLNPVAVFAPHEGSSANVTYVSTNADQTRNPVTRAVFYETCWEPLKATYSAALPNDAKTWEVFVKTLLNDDFPTQWPSNLPVKSSAFIKRFTIDILLACMNQHNTVLSGKNPLWQRAILIEAGENRHVGNEYTPEEVSAAVAKILEKLDSFPLVPASPKLNGA